jgi:hypothetical protein
MRTVEVGLYKFKELKPEVQQKVLDEHREMSVDWTDWHDWILEEEEQRLAKKGILINISTVCFDVCRENDLSFEADIDLKKLLRNAKDKTEYYSILNQKDKRYVNYAVKQRGYGGNVPSMEIGWEIEHFRDDDLEFEDRLQELGEKLADHIEHLVLEEAGKVLKRVREEYEYRTSDEGVKDCIEANDYEFEENGSMR